MIEIPGIAGPKPAVAKSGGVSLGIVLVTIEHLGSANDDFAAFPARDLAPGFIDSHTHLTSDYSGNHNERRIRSLSENISQLALEMIPHAKVTLEAGFASVRA